MFAVGTSSVRPVAVSITGKRVTSSSGVRPQVVDGQERRQGALLTALDDGPLPRPPAVVGEEVAKQGQVGVDAVAEVGVARANGMADGGLDDE